MSIAAIFSGQGSQFPGMMKEQIDKYDSCKSVLKIADDVTGKPISKLVTEGPQEELNLTVYTQPCVLAADLISYTSKKEEGFVADAVAGFSLGEYAALVASGVFSIEQAFDIVNTRAEAMDKAAPVGMGAMAAVIGKTSNEVEKLCEQVDGYVVPVNYNCPVQTVVSGSVEAIDEFVALAREQKIRCMKLNVSAPFHCKYMDSAADVLKQKFQNEIFRTASVPVYMNVDAKACIDPEEIKDKLIRQVNSPVLWEKTIRNMNANGVSEFIECGPGTTLTTFVKKTLGV